MAEGATASMPHRRSSTAAKSPSTSTQEKEGVCKLKEVGGVSLLLAFRCAAIMVAEREEDREEERDAISLIIVRSVAAMLFPPPIRLCRWRPRRRAAVPPLPPLAFREEELQQRERERVCRERNMTIHE
ncbi:uncharacterized protein DS421_10g317240 [Arachis hypogaea]|nr:uncharacterized protein DS421_10g317240 [Arachis hypogaea]